MSGTSDETMYYMDLEIEELKSENERLRAELERLRESAQKVGDKWRELCRDEATYPEDLWEMGPVIEELEAMLRTAKEKGTIPVTATLSGCTVSGGVISDPRVVSGSDLMMIAHQDGNKYGVYITNKSGDRIEWEPALYEAPADGCGVIRG